MPTEVCQRDHLRFRFPVPLNPLNEHPAEAEPNLEAPQAANKRGSKQQHLSQLFPKRLPGDQPDVRPNSQEPSDLLRQHHWLQRPLQE